MGSELAAFGVCHRRSDRDFDADCSAVRFALNQCTPPAARAANDLRSALLLFLLKDPVRQRQHTQ